MSRKSSHRITLTQVALRNIQQIFDYSLERWGKEIAEKYLDEIESGLARIRENPGLLQAGTDLPASLKFYRVHKHLFICDAQPRSTVVLTVIHSSMDIPSRLAELQPTMAEEVEMLHRRLGQKKTTKR